MNYKQRYSDSWVTEIPRSTVVNLVIALCALPMFALLEQTTRLELPPSGEIVLLWVVAVTVIGVAIGLEACSSSDLGFRRPTKIDFVYLIGTTVASLLVFVGTDPLVTALGLPVSEDSTAMTAGVGLELAFAGAVTTGIVEEVLYRGYAIERLIGYSESPAIAGGISWGTFTVGHAVVWPIGNLVQVATVSAVFTLVYLRRRTLFPVIGSHVLVWCLAVMGQVYG